MVHFCGWQETMNRPFNGNNLVDDVAASFKKSLVVKALAALTEEAAIQVKLFGKVHALRLIVPHLGAHAGFDSGPGSGPAALACRGKLQ
jgi:hypothetical protein